MEALNEQDWRILIATIHEKRCVLLLGPGVAVAPDDPGVPLTTRLAHRLADQLPPGEATNCDNLAHVAQLYQHHFRARMKLEFAVRDFYAPYSKATTVLHQELAKLPFTLCVNTTLDHFLLNAFQDAGKTPIHEFYDFRKARDSYLTDTDPSHPIVYDLYGNIGKSSQVLTENDLLDFLVNVINSTPPLSPFIKARFKEATTSFLFLGFGFRHWYVRILLHILQTHGHENPSLALEDAVSFDYPEWPQTAVFFEKQHLIEFRHQSWESFASTLREKYEEFIGSEPGETLELPADAPRVFLCHSHQDRDRVASLAKQLQALGIAIWLDRQNLRGGDNWERQIPQVIRKQVDYVVILQSTAMLDKAESYFYKEINEALERQKGFAEGFRFVIPAQLERGVMLAQLDNLHSPDLTTSQGIRELVQAIQEDWKRPERRRIV
jgi:hypothetical protein